MKLSCTTSVLAAMWRSSPLASAAFAPSPFQPDGPVAGSNGYGNHHLRSSGTSASSRREVRRIGMAPDPADAGEFPSEDDATRRAKSLNEQARRASLEAERMEAELTLEKIARLEEALRMSSSPAAAGGGGNGMREDGKAGKRDDIRSEIEQLAKKIDPTIALPGDGLSGVVSSSVGGWGVGVGGGGDAAFLPSSARARVPLSTRELEDAVAYFDSLPVAMRITLSEAVDVEYEGDTEKIVSRLHERMDGLSTDEIREYYVEGSKKPTQQEFQDLLVDFEDAIMVETSVDSQIPRQARKEGKAPSAADVKAFFSEICGKDTFQPSEQPVQAGEVWVIRGTNTRKSPQDLVDEISRKLERRMPSWSESNQFCYINDPSLKEGVDDVFGDPVVLIANKDMSPTANGLLVSAATGAGLLGAFLFCLATFGSNPVIMNRLQEASAAGDYELSWFNDLLFPLLASLATIQFSHEMAHQLVAWRDKMKVSPPMILPSAGLPYLTFLRRIKTSPTNFQSLYDFGFAGPVTGIVFSLGFLLFGLQLTTTVDPEAVQYLPSLPVAFVKLSSLGGTLVDQVVGSGTGMLLNQDPNAQIPLHPFAIAGFTGLMINALDLIPIGGSDGARVILSMLGRVGQTVVSGSTYIALLFALIFFDDQKDIFLTFAVINTLVQRDMEIPCQNEIDKVGLSRATAALGAFFVAALILVPLS